MADLERIRANAAKYRASVTRAETWLLSKLNRNGTMDPVEKGALTYYKVPRGWAIVGRLKEALSMLDWAKRDLFTEEGDFAATRQAFHHHHYTYSSAWYVWCSQVLARFDMSYRGLEYLLRFRNPKTGGYCSEATFGEGQPNEQDLLSTAFNSFVGLHLGHLSEAKEAADWIVDLLEQQPEPERMLWLRRDEDGELITKVGEACDEPRFYVLEVSAPTQFYYYLGAAMVFLAKLYDVTLDPKHLHTAKGVYHLCQKCHEDVYLTDGTGKVGLGSAFLFRSTGEMEFAESAMRSCDFLVADQAEEGCWIRGGKPTASSTAEFVVWLWEVSAILQNYVDLQEGD